jgi:MerR family transcriptional regulator/heat shock protein HspR
MKPSILPREEVAEHLTISTKVLLKLERRGLVRAVREGNLEGYGPAEIRRVWTIVSFRRDLGINLAGIEVILRLRDQMAATQLELKRLAQRLEDSLVDPAEVGTESDE